MRKKQSRQKEEALCFASRMLADQKILVAGQFQHTIFGTVQESRKNLDQLHKLKDMLAADWRESQQGAEELRKDLVKAVGWKLMRDYDDFRTQEDSANQEAAFLLGYAAALRLTGR